MKKNIEKPEPGSEDDLIDKFSEVFHSFRNLHKVAPVTFLAKLKRRGVVLSPQETAK